MTFPAKYVTAEEYPLRYSENFPLDVGVLADTILGARQF